MLHHITHAPQPVSDAVLRNMFAARKRVFVDILRWELPVLAERFEIDQFDTPEATYLILSGKDGQHRASARLLPTTRPHILDTLFDQLCDEPVPRGEDVAEITRFCLDPALGAKGRRAARGELVHALTRFALDNGISHYTGVAQLGWLEQILAFGWRCRTLGEPRRIGQARLGALLIEIDKETPALLERAGLHASSHPDEAYCHAA